MKTIAAETAVLYGGSFLQSYTRQLEEAYLNNADSLKCELQDLEEGGILAKLGIANFLEADYFSWYLDEWNDDIAGGIIEIVKKLSEYEPATAELEPDSVKDLFKRLYQNLVPKKTRHDLGEYYTPDWLAELLLDEVDFTVDGFGTSSELKDPKDVLDLRVLDPACGSGTFLVLAIKRIKEYADDHFLDKSEVLEKLSKGIVGFDLNPLAVIASRANYLIALGELIRYRRGPIELPVYLADSILVERRSTLKGIECVLRTSVGEFRVPTSVVEKELLGKTLSLIESCVHLNYAASEFETRLGREIGLGKTEISGLIDLYRFFLQLEKAGKNRIWTRILKNSFAPFFAGRFDYIVGNPPWVNWTSLPDDYRDITKDLWISQGLVREGAVLGKASRDMAMLFVTVCVNRYMNSDGKLGLLVPFTLFKSHAGAGFRVFLARKCRVSKVHDLVALRPFEGAVNRTALLSLTRGITKFPVDCQLWDSQNGGAIDFRLPLSEVKKSTSSHKIVMFPIEGEAKPESPWLGVTRGAKDAVLRAVGSSRYYEAHKGVGTDLNSAYWIKVLDKQQNDLLVRNFSKIGKKKLKEITTLVEPGLVFPLLRGRDTRKWYSRPSAHIIVPHDPRTGLALSEHRMKVDYPKTYRYLVTFKQELRSRPNLILQKGPFYAVYGIGAYTYAPYKVMWKYISGRIAGKGKFSATVVSEIDDEQTPNKTIIPNEKLVIVPFESLREAHYVAAVLNSSIARLIVAGYTIETEISTHVLNYVKVPKFNASNGIFRKISDLSEKAHKLAVKDDKKGLSRVEEEIDSIVAKGLFKLTLKQLDEIKTSLRILEGRSE
jgi:SAM-dependent methyltransferase